MAAKRIKLSEQHTRLNKKEFFDKTCEVLAKSLLGCVLVCKSAEGVMCSARIVETEAYLGVEDKGAHSYRGKRTDRTEPMFMPPGTCYIYYIYGTYCCFNISSKGEGAAVLVRAAQPLTGVDVMNARRQKNKRSNSNKCKTALKLSELCNGPSKMCQALAITKNELNKEDILTSDKIWIETAGDKVNDDEIEMTPRIGVNYAEEWADKPLRFVIKDNPYVSKGKLSINESKTNINSNMS